MCAAPFVSVVTAVYNAERFLSATIESVLNQTWSGFEYILVDDGSSDSTPSILERFAAQDKRILLYHTGGRVGPPGALNLAYQAARGVYLANLDHDDLAMPERLAKQVAFLEQNPTIGAVGCVPIVINQMEQNQVEAPAAAASNPYRHYRVPFTPPCARWLVQFEPPILHSSLMMRSPILAQIGGYSLRHRFVCDYEMMVRLVEVTDITNLRERLAVYRIHPEQSSQRYRAAQHGMQFLTIAATMRRRLGHSAALADIQAWFDTSVGLPIADGLMLHRVAALLERLYQRNVESEALLPHDLAWIELDYAMRLRLLIDVNKALDEQWHRPLVDRANQLQASAQELVIY